MTTIVNVKLILKTFTWLYGFSFEEFHIWHQFANSLICARKVSTLLIVRECDVCTIYIYYVDTADENLMALSNDYNS
jgi:hypothetical protein